MCEKRGIPDIIFIDFLIGKNDERKYSIGWIA